MQLLTHTLRRLNYLRFKLWLQYEYPDIHVTVLNEIFNYLCEYTHKNLCVYLIALTYSLKRQFSLNCSTLRQTQMMGILSSCIFKETICEQRDYDVSNVKIMHFLEKNDPCFNSNEERNIILKTILDHKILSKEIEKKEGNMFS